MKRIIYIAIVILSVSSCVTNGKYDAQGTFDATEVVLSSEATGRILSFDIEEGMPVKAGVVVGTIDSLQLILQQKQLSAQLSALLDSRPDKKAQVASLREQIAKQKIELNRVKNMLKDGAATQKIIKKNGLSRGACTKGKPIFYKSKVFVRFVPKKRKRV